MRYSKAAKAMIKDAMRSPGYRKFRRMFKVKCAKCGSTYCSVHTGLAKKTFLRTNYGKARVGFVCLNCAAYWTHAYNINTLYKKSKEVLKDTDHTYERGGDGNGYRRLNEDG